jgi:hypothetical protein
MKFTIRDLLLVTVIVALAVGWGLDHSIRAFSEEFWRDFAEEKSWGESQKAPDWHNKHSKGLPLPNSQAPARIRPSRDAGLSHARCG